MIWSNFKDISQISLILRAFDPYLPLYPSIHKLIFKLVSLDFVLTWHRVYLTTAHICFVSDRKIN